ncbi:hypothetical protein ILUMI_21211, partial [Ignelater luminosus]
MQGSEKDNKKKELFSLPSSQLTSNTGNRITSNNSQQTDLFLELRKLSKLLLKLTSQVCLWDKHFCSLIGDSLTTVQRTVRVAAPKGSKQVGQATSAETGCLVTLCCGMNAIENCISSCFIFPRANFRPYMLNEAPIGLDGLAHSGFASAGIWPFNSNIFSDNDYLYFAVTDRAMPNTENTFFGQNPSTSTTTIPNTDYGMVEQNPSTSAVNMFDTDNAPIENASILSHDISVESVRAYPKAGSRKDTK